MVLRNNFPFLMLASLVWVAVQKKAILYRRGKIIKFMLVIAFTLSRFFMVNKEEFAELELDIKERRRWLG